MRFGVNEWTNFERIIRIKTTEVVNISRFEEITLIPTVCLLANNVILFVYFFIGPV